MGRRLDFWVQLFRMGVFWPLLRLTIQYPRHEKRLWWTRDGYRVGLVDDPGWQRYGNRK